MRDKHGSRMLVGRRTIIGAVRGISTGGAGEVRGDDIGGVPIQRGPGAVVPHRDSWVGVAGGLVNISKRDADVERGGGESVPQSVWTDRLGDAGPLRDAAHEN
jgi:hypothetical protein